MMFMNILQSFRLWSMVLFVACMQVPALAANSSDSVKKVALKTGKVVLRNGTLADLSRTKEGWQSLQKIRNICMHGEDFWLWRTCLDAEELHISSCDVRAFKAFYHEHLNETSIALFDYLGITHNGILDKQTQNIILSSYSGSREGKIVFRMYPIKKWYESIPGYHMSRFLFG